MSFSGHPPQEDAHHLTPFLVPRILKNPPIRVRIRSRLSLEQASELRRLRELFGFRSDYQFVQASVQLFIRLLQRAEAGGLREEDKQMGEDFATFYDWEAPTYGKRPPKGTKEEGLVRLLFGDELDEETRAGTKSAPVLSPDRGAEAEGWLERFTAHYYDQLWGYFARLPAPPSSDGSSSLDIFHDTLLRLRFAPEEVTTYEAFERYALGKFHHRPGITPDAPAVLDHALASASSRPA